MRLALRLARYVVLLFLLMLLTVVMILTLGRIDVRVSAEGRVTHPDARTVRTSVKGTVEQVCVREGDQVAQGEPLVLIDRSPFRQRKSELEGELRDNEREREFCRSTRKRLLELIHLQERLQVEQRIFQARQELAANRTRLNRLRTLAELGIASVEELDEAESRMQIIRSSCEYLEAEKILVLNRHAAALEELEQRETGLADDRGILEQQLALVARDLEQTVVTAPVSGFVLTREPETLRDRWVTEGEPLIDLGASGRFVFRALVADRNMREIEPEMEAEIALSAFPYRQYGFFAGKVLSISMRPVEGAEGPSYLVDCSIAPFEVEVETAGQREMIPVKLGMTGEADIILRKRVRIITYLWETLTEAASI